MIVVSRYQPSFYDHVVMLHESNDALFGETPDTLPQIGFIATEGSIIVAVGFLRQVEGNMALLDTLATNGSCSSKMRHEGIKAVVDALIDAAKSMKLKYFIAFTADEGIIKRASGLGFVITEQKFIALDLSNGPK